MTPERWQRAQALFHACLELGSTQQRRLLAEEASDDPALQEEVLSLLAAAASPATFLERPALSGEAPGDPAAAEPAADEPSQRLGQRLGAFEITAKIADGGMGAVYRARRADGQYEQEVAIKIGGREGAAMLERFAAERQILASLDHPNIAKLLDAGVTPEGAPYFVMEFIAGEPIDAYCESRRLGTNERLRLFQTVCAAVQYAHQHLIVHRDLKPGNILVTAQGVVKLLDFGIAKALDARTPLYEPTRTLTSLRALTPEYASPEQIRGEAITTASDVYSLGVVLYRLLTGRSPYRSPTTDIYALASEVCESEPARPSAQLRSHEPRAATALLTRDLDSIVLKALRKAPAQRYALVGEFAQDIERYLTGRPVLARRGTALYRAGKFVRRNTWPVAATGVVLLSVAAAFVATQRSATIARDERTVAIRERERAQRHFNDLRKLSNTLVFQIFDSVRTLPGASRSSHLLMNTAIGYLDALAREAEGDPTLQLELAGAYRRLGEVQGRFEASEDDYAGALQSFRKSLGLYQALLAAAPADFAVRGGETNVYDRLSDLSWNTGDAAATLAYARAGALVIAAPESASGAALDVRYLRAMGLEDYPFKLFKISGDVAGTLPALRAAMTELEALMTLAPDNARIARSLAVSCYRAGQVLQQQHEYLEALALEERGRGALAPFLKGTPPNSSLEFEDLASEHFAAAALARIGRLSEAIQYEQEAVSRVRALATADPHIAEFGGFEGVGLTAMAEMTEQQQRPERALELLHQALPFLETALAAGSGHPEIRYGRAKAQSLLGTALAMRAANPQRAREQRLQDWRDARDWYQRAAVSLAELAPVWFDAAEEGRHVSAELERCDRMLGR